MTYALSAAKADAFRSQSEGLSLRLSAAPRPAALRHGQRFKRRRNAWCGTASGSAAENAPAISVYERIEGHVRRAWSPRLDDRTLWAKTMTVEEHGLAPALRSPWFAAVSTLTAFILSGLVPILGYLLAGGLTMCVAATGLAFLASEPSRAGGR